MKTVGENNCGERNWFIKKNCNEGKNYRNLGQKRKGKHKVQKPVGVKNTREDSTEKTENWIQRKIPELR